MPLKRDEKRLYSPSDKQRWGLEKTTKIHLVPRGDMNTHILVVEDNLDNSKLVSWILEDEGYDVTCVERGERCLALLEKHDYDLTLLDIYIPRLKRKDGTR